MHAHDWVPQVVFGLSPMWVASALLIITYAAVMTERINRAVVALLGAGLTIILGLLNQEAALRGVDFNTLGLLVGMMLIVAITRRTGLFEFLAVWAAKQMRGNPAGIMFILQVITAVASACLDNVTTVLLVVPVTLVITEQLKVPPYPYLIKLLVPKRLQRTPMPIEKTRPITSSEKMVFAVVICVLLSLLFPVASPLILSLFLGVLVRESRLTPFADLLAGPVLYGATFFLGLLLGVLCEANTILNPVVLNLLLLGMIALLISGIGGILGSYVLYFASGGRYNPPHYP